MLQDSKQACFSKFSSSLGNFGFLLGLCEAPGKTKYGTSANFRIFDYFIDKLMSAVNSYLYE